MRGGLSERGGSLWHPREGSWPGHNQSIPVNRLAISAQGNRSELALIKITKGAQDIFEPIKGKAGSDEPLKPQCLSQGLTQSKSSVSGECASDSVPVPHGSGVLLLATINDHE